MVAVNESQHEWRVAEAGDRIDGYATVPLHEDYFVMRKMLSNDNCCVHHVMHFSADNNVREESYFYEFEDGLPVNLTTFDNGETDFLRFIEIDYEVSPAQLKTYAINCEDIPEFMETADLTKCASFIKQAKNSGLAKTVWRCFSSAA